MSTTCCPDYEPGMKAVNAPILLQFARSGGRQQYNFKPFAYCPWCGKSRDSALVPTPEGVKPFTPADAKEKKLSTIPDFVIEAVNELLAENLSGGSATILQKEIVSRIKKKKRSLSESKIFDNKWLDFEDVFRKAGWRVDYDKPAYNEDYEASFRFEKKKG